MSDEALTPDSIFAIGSVSKPFTASAVLQLEANGEIDRSQTVSSLIPELTGPAGEATIGSLLAHTSGIVGSIGDDLQSLSRDEAIDAVNALTIDRSARGTFLYSNAGYTMLALVLEAVSGEPYRTFMLDGFVPEGAGFWDGEPVPTGDRVVGEVDGRRAPGSSVGDPGQRRSGDVGRDAGTLGERRVHRRGDRRRSRSTHGPPGRGVERSGHHRRMGASAGGRAR
jgi:CubicO group peptidase (beta-lactamase class C family)